MTEEKEKTYNKLQSRRFWICIWACALLTAIVAGSYIRNDYSMTGLAMGLEGIIGAYIGIESFNKKYKLQQEARQDQEDAE